VFYALEYIKLLHLCGHAASYSDVTKMCKFTHFFRVASRNRLASRQGKVKESAVVPKAPCQAAVYKVLTCSHLAVLPLAEELQIHDLIGDLVAPYLVWP
jgi:hypothetical protein